MTVTNEELLPLFAEVRRLMKPYEDLLVARRDEPDYYGLCSEMDVVIDGRKQKEVFFAGLIVQKTYVGFYFIPPYADGDLRAVFGPELLATLKGRSCFTLRQRLLPGLWRAR